MILFFLAATMGQAQTYTASWSSVDRHNPAPEWFQDAKFGLWFHWGPYSVPAYKSEWYPRYMYIQGNSGYTHHTSVYGDPYTSWGYDKFITGANDLAGTYVKFAPKLTSAGGKFDPNEWAQLFYDAGAKMAGPVAEHHDGFSMWASAVNEWNSVSKGPGLDLVGLFAAAFRAKGMKFLVSSHNAYNFHGYFNFVPAQTSTSLRKLYGQLPVADEEALWVAKLKELIDKYQPDYMWHDMHVRDISEAKRLEYLAYYYNAAVSWGKDVVVSYNDGFNTRGEVQQIERGGTADITYPFWLCEDSVSSSSWSYTQGIRYYSGKAILHSLIDRVSKNGSLLLDIAPMADGSIPQAQKDILAFMGRWLKANGEAVYATRAWVKFGEGPTILGKGGMSTPVEATASDIRFTRNKANNVLYAIGLGWPSNNQMAITSLSSSAFNTSTITGITFIGGGACSWSQDSTALRIDLPSSLANTAGYAVKITFSGTIPTLAGGFSGYYKILARHSGKAVVVQSASTANGANVFQWTYGGSATNDEWAFVNLGTGYYKVVNRNSGRVLNVQGASTVNGGDVNQWAWANVSQQMWQVTNLGNGYYKLTAKNSGKVLNVQGASTSDGADVNQWSWANVNQQMFQIVSVP